MGANNSERNTQRDNRKWRGRGRGHGRGRWVNKQNWNKRKQNETSDNDQFEGSVTKSSQNDSKNCHNFVKRERRFSYSQMIPESDLGISEYICKDKKISGLLKQMYSDFIVHEIDTDGNVVKLTSFEVPTEDETANSTDNEKDSIIPDEKWQELTNLLEVPKDAGDSSKEVKIDVTELDKDSRGKTHAAIRKVFGRKLQSNTLEVDGRKLIVVKKWKGAGDRRDNWKRGKDKQYLYFTVHKQDMDTSETVNRISEKLRFRPGNLNFAGTKDRRACTSQRMSLWHGEPKSLKNLNIRNVWIGDYEFKGQTMKLGQLKGNLFTIALRDISNTDEEVAKNMTSLKENGFINYFGTQRFGTNKNAPTHLIGKALLQGNWEKAVNLILHPRDNRYGIKGALDCWQKEKDGKKALSLVKGSWSSLEVSLLKGLASAAKNDYLKAFNQLPRNLRLLYLHAYQSFIWNRVVSRRIRQFGLKTLPGDLVLVDGSSAEETPDAEIDGDARELELTSQNEVSEAGRDSSSTPNEQDEGVKVRVITAEEAEKTPIDQVVLPTPGFKITLPENEVKEWYSEMLAEDGLTIESLRQKSKEYSVGGSYRNIITKPTQLEWKILRYKDPKAPLLRTDIEELKGKPEPQDDQDGTLRAVIVKIGLGTSTYATVALREVVDYIGAHQKKNEIEDAEIKKRNDTNKERTDGEPEKVRKDLDATENVTVNECTTDKTSVNVEMEVDTSKTVTLNESTNEVPKKEKIDEDTAENVSTEPTSDEKCAASEDNELLSSNRSVKREADSAEDMPAKKARLESKDKDESSS